MDRVWAKVDRRGDDECWPWTGYCHPDGHGMYGDSNYVHRLIYEETHSTKPPVVRHSCDNPPCCNPRHLLGGTQADNMKDMADRGRSIKGRQLKTRKVKT
jgi:hypothetical protein